MLSIEGILGLLNDKNKKVFPFIYKWRDVYYRMSLHIDGITPIFEATLNGLDAKVIYRDTAFRDYFDTNYQYIFDAVLFARYPNEPTKTRNWRYSTYKPFTQDPFQRAIQTITGGIFQESGYQVTIHDKDDNDYIWGANFEGKNLVSYISDKFQNICNDPNGFFVTMPKEPHFATTTKSIEPKICFIPSKDIIYVTDDEIVFEYDDYHWNVNKIGYFRFKKEEGTGQYYHVDEANGGYFAHMTGKLPIIVAGGLWNTQGYYESWLKAARPFADEYVIGMSDEMMVMKQASFPFITFAATQCPDCEHGKIQLCTSCHSDSCSCGTDHSLGSNLQVVNCQKCGGTGGVSINPGDVLIAPPEDMEHALVKVETIPVDVNKLHMERNKGIKDAMLQALHLNFIDEAQSGVAKAKDMETRYQFYLKISNDLFNRLIKHFVENIISLRHATSVSGTLQPVNGKLDQYYTIVTPTQFDIYTTYDLSEEFKMSKDAGLPTYMINRILDDYTDKRFGGDDILKRKTWFINNWDILANVSYADISIVLLNNGASDRDLQYHLQLPVLLAQVVKDRGDEWFLNSKEDVIKDEVDTLFSAMKPPTPTIQPEIQERVEV